MILIFEINIVDGEPFPTEIQEDVKNLIMDYLVKQKVQADIVVYEENVP